MTPKPVTISAWSAAGTFHSVLNMIASDQRHDDDDGDDDDAAWCSLQDSSVRGVTSTSAGRLVVDDDDLRVRLDRAAVDVAGEERLDAAADGDHHLARAARADASGGGHPAAAADWRSCSMDNAALA